MYGIPGYNGNNPKPRSSTFDASAWAKLIVYSALTFIVTVLVGYGALQLFIDTGRAILH